MDEKLRKAITAVIYMWFGDEDTVLEEQNEVTKDRFDWATEAVIEAIQSHYSGMGLELTEEWNDPEVQEIVGIYQNRFNEYSQIGCLKGKPFDEWDVCYRVEFWCVIETDISKSLERYLKAQRDHDSLIYSAREAKLKQEDYNLIELLKEQGNIHRHGVEIEYDKEKEKWCVFMPCFGSSVRYCDTIGDALKVDYKAVEPKSLKSQEEK